MKQEQIWGVYKVGEIYKNHKVMGGKPRLEEIPYPNVRLLSTSISLTNDDRVDFQVMEIRRGVQGVPNRIYINIIKKH